MSSNTAVPNRGWRTPLLQMDPAGPVASVSYRSPAVFESCASNGWRSQWSAKKEAGEMAVDSSHSNAEPEAVSFAAPRGRFIPFGIPFGSATRWFVAERASRVASPVPPGTTFSTVSWCLLGCARARSGSQPFHTEPPVRCPRCRDENFAREIEIFVDSKGVKYPMALICSIAIRRLATSLVAKRGATTGQLVLFGKRLE